MNEPGQRRGVETGADVAETFRVREDLAELYGSFYDDGTSEWRELGAVDKADNVLRLGAQLGVKSVIDIGAGEGAVLGRLAAAGFGEEHYALEISPSGVAAIQSRDIPSLVDCRLFNGYQIDYPNDRFDLAILSHVLEHAEFPRRLLYEAGRVARMVFIEVPLEENLRAAPHYQDDGVGHINHYSHRTIRKFVQASGFRVRAEHYAATSYRVLRFKHGWRAVFKYYPKAAMLRLVPKWALNRYAFNAALLCESPRSAPGMAPGSE